MASRRTQPHRASSRRRESTALASMQRGGSAYMDSPGDVRRHAMKKKKVKRKGRARDRGPMKKVLRTRRRMKRRY